MISEERLRGIEANGHVFPSELAQLIAAARVANAAAQSARDRRDGGDGNWTHYRRSRYGFHRALDRYTQPQPKKVNA